jgi:hypothetical protein
MALVAALVVSLLGASAVAIIAALPAWETRGIFGDMFGAANALFSGLTFAGMVYTLLMQNTELQLQRDELRMARDEQARLVVATQESAESLRKQFQKQTLAVRISILQARVTEALSEKRRASLSLRLRILVSLGQVQRISPQARTIG